MHIYLSPHQDDICFSLGNIASRFGGHLVNLYTRSRYVALAMALPADPHLHLEAVTRLRREEDLRFARATGLVRHDLELPEPASQGRHPFDLTDIDAEATRLSSRMVPYLLSLLSDREPGSANLFCPMGIGGHRDHLSTLLAVRAAYDALSAHCTLYLYEDLPYASAPEARNAGLRHAAYRFRGFRLSGRALLLNETESARKMQHVRLYASQLGGLPREAGFTPASGIAAAPHEVVWQVTPPKTAEAEHPEKAPLRRIG